MEIIPTLLIVEDELINRMILRKMLADSYHILEAENGQVAWDILCDRSNSISAVLLDLVMPVMDGYGVLEKIRQAHMEDLPVIVMTGETDAEAERRALDGGAWDFVTKPYDVRVLLRRLSNAIARSKLPMPEEVRRTSQLDSLTGLYNRRKTFEETNLLVRSHPETSFVFLRADINYFSMYNASFGEAEGNRLLLFFANMLSRCARAHMPSVFGRINSDIFAVCIPFDGDKDKLTAEVRACARQLADYSKDYLLEMAVGAYVVDNPLLSAEDYYVRASKSAEQCKSDFGELIVFFDAALGKQMEQEIGIASEMQKALDDGQFTVFYQPKFRLSTNRSCGAEALVRWIHPTKGMIVPGMFIPVFERNGFIAKLDNYVWDTVCRALRSWLDQGATPEPISVNISRISLHNPKLVEVLVNMVKHYGFDPALLQLEITESAYMSNPELMQTTIHGLRQAGFTILMDDFGSAYSSLNTLKSIEIDVLKVDMKFLPVGDQTEKGEIILASVIHMANWLGMSVIVEGVENRRQRDFLEATGCDCVQGYYYSRPVPRSEYERLYVFSPESQAAEAIQPPATPAAHGTLLVIDASAEERAMLASFFKEQYHLSLCDSAEEGLAYLKRNAPAVKLMLVDSVLPGMNGMELLHYCHVEPMFRDIPQILLTEKGCAEEEVRAFQEGAYDYIVKPLVREVMTARVEHVMSVAHQLTLHEQTEEWYRHQAEMDKSTGLLNKASFRELCTRLIENRGEERKALIVLDVDDFKVINDSRGHMMGDDVVLTIANELMSGFRKSDVLGRFGGDEFVVLMSSLPHSGVAKRKANEIAKAVLFACMEKFHLNVTLSIGIAELASEDTYDTLFARADAAMYYAKRNGKGRTVVYGEEEHPVFDDDKSVVLVCGTDPQLYPAISFSGNENTRFAQITDLNALRDTMAKYHQRICTVCLDMRIDDAENYYACIRQLGDGRVPVVAVCPEGDMHYMRRALALEVTDVIAIPLQMDVVQRCLDRSVSNALRLNEP